MKLNIDTKEFFSVVSKLQGVIDKKNTIPLLSNLLLKTNEQRLCVTGTDLGIGIKVECDADVVTDGTITLSARKLFEILKEIPEGVLTLETAENNLVILSCQNSLFKMFGLAAENYPVLTEFSEENMFKLNKELLQEMTYKTEFAISSESNRLVFTGIQFVKNESILRMTATDGHRLAIIKRKYEEPAQDFEFILPKKTCREILNLIEEAGEDILFSCSENKVVFKFGRTQLVSNLIEGKYPDMEKAIPAIEDNLLSFNRKAMLGAIRRVSIFSDSVSYGIRFDLDKDRVTILSNDPELGEAKEELEVSYEGQPMAVGFNSRYIQEVLGILKSEDVTMKLTDPSSSALVLDPDDKEFLCLIMPMRI